VIRAYLAGPDVFFADAAAIAAAKIALCARNGLAGVHPFTPATVAAAKLPGAKAWREIYRLDIEMLRACDIVIANLTPFRGVSADAGTAVEIGIAAGLGMKIFAYTNDGRDLATRIRDFCARTPEPDGTLVEDFGLADNLMIPGAIAQSGGAVLAPPAGVRLPDTDLAVFERAVLAAAS
jgi:nucleoside 2-deoxyribosyltransferase